MKRARGGELKVDLENPKNHLRPTCDVNLAFISARPPHSILMQEGPRGMPTCMLPPSDSSFINMRTQSLAKT